jgi:hypothetical protein
MDSEALKALLSTPIALFAIMLFGSLISMVMQLRDARKNGATISFGDFFLTIETVITLGTNVLAFGGLIMTDTLNWTGALGIGYALNHLSDLSPGGRSAAVVDSIPNSPKP